MSFKNVYISFYKKIKQNKKLHPHFTGASTMTLFYVQSCQKYENTSCNQCH